MIIENEIDWNYEADVVVAGYGGAGAAASIEAHDAGAEVLIIEKSSRAGGTTAMSAGIILGAGTSMQREMQVTDSAADMYRYLRATGKGLEDPDLARVYCENSGPNIEWLLGLGMEFKELKMSGSENSPEYAAVINPRPRGHYAASGGAFFRVLKNACRKRKIQVRYNTCLKDMVMGEGEAVTGIVAESEGHTLYIKARKAVVLACGGYGCNREMLRQYSFDKGYRAVYAGSVHSTGDGIRAGQMMGADLVCMGQIAAIPVVQRPGQKIVRLANHNPKNADRSLSIIAVNKKGERFTDESGFYNYIAYDMLLPGNLPNYVVFDETARRGGKETWPEWSGVNNRDIKDGTTKTAETIRNLALKAGIDPDGLESTVNRYNVNAEKGIDPDFGKAVDLAPLRTPPFYAFERVVGISSTLGGLKINTSAQVVNVRGAVISRLYACGENAGGAIGLNYPASGAALQNAVCFGRIAGKNAASEYL